MSSMEESLATGTQVPAGNQECTQDLNVLENSESTLISSKATMLHGMTFDALRECRSITDLCSLQSVATSLCVITMGPHM